MKLMIVGFWRGEIYEAAFASGLSEHGVEVIPCKISQFFNWLFGKYRSGFPLFDFFRWELNDHVLSRAESEKPDWILFWRPTHILPSTLKRLALLGIKTVSYNVDDPFGPRMHGNVPWHHHFLWYFYLRCLPYFDRNFFNRKINCEEALDYGVKSEDRLLNYFIPRKDRPVQLNVDEQKKFGTDVVFVGHYEPDGRENSVRALLDAGIKLKIWGGHYWSQKVLGDLYERLAPITLVEGDDYARALCGAKICLAFLSKMNRDTYTGRCFEIPACGRVMLAERTDDLQQMFKEDEEACFFSSNEELVEKACWLLENPERREQIAQAGRKRVWKDGHDVTSRAKKFLEALEA